MRRVGRPACAGSVAAVGPGWGLAVDAGARTAELERPGFYPAGGGRIFEANVRALAQLDREPGSA